MWGWLSTELQDLILSHQRQEPSWYRIGVDSDWVTLLSATCDYGTRLSFPLDNFDLMPIPHHVLVRGFLCEGRLAFKFDEFEKAFASVRNHVNMSREGGELSITFDCGVAFPIKGSAATRKLFSNARMCAVSKHFCAEAFCADCLLDLRTVMHPGYDEVGIGARFLTVKKARPRTVEMVMCIRNERDGSDLSVLANVLGTMHDDSFYCELTAFPSFFWVGDDDDFDVSSNPDYDSQPWAQGGFLLNSEGDIMVTHAELGALRIGTVKSDEVCIDIECPAGAGREMEFLWKEKSSV